MDAQRFLDCTTEQRDVADDEGDGTQMPQSDAQATMATIRAALIPSRRDKLDAQDDATRFTLFCAFLEESRASFGFDDALTVQVLIFLDDHGAQFLPRATYETLHSLRARQLLTLTDTILDWCIGQPLDDEELIVPASQVRLWVQRASATRA